MLCSLVTALSIRAACAGLLLPPVFCRGLAVKFISELSAPNKSSPPGAIWQIRPREPTCSAEESRSESRPGWGPGPCGGGLSPHQPRACHTPSGFSHQTQDGGPGFGGCSSSELFAPLWGRASHPSPVSPPHLRRCTQSPGV